MVELVVSVTKPFLRRSAISSALLMLNPVKIEQGPRSAKPTVQENSEIAKETTPIKPLRIDKLKPEVKQKETLANFFMISLIPCWFLLVR